MRHLISIIPSFRMWISALFVISIFSSCNKLERTNVGSELIPGTDRLSTDTLYLEVNTFQSQPNEVNLDTNVVEKSESHATGYLNDPVFGTTTAATYFQPLPAAYPFKFPVSRDSLFVDSLVLSVAYAGMYGDTNAVNTFSVYRVEDADFNGSRRYRLNEAPNVNGSIRLGQATVNHAQLSSGYRLAYKNDTVSAQLRMRLSSDLAASLLSQEGFLTDSAFKSFLRGLALIPDSSKSGIGVLHYFQLNAPSTRLELYYRALKADGKTDTTAAYFPFVANNNRSANANKIHRNLSSVLSGSGQSDAYVMSAPGTSVAVQLKGLEDLVGKPYIIHRADLVATQIADNNVLKDISVPVTHLFALNDAGQQMPIPYDSVFYYTKVSFDAGRNVFLHAIAQTYCGGIPKFINVNGQSVAEYRYNLTRYIQNVINRNTAIRSLRIAAPYYAFFAGGNISQLPF
ncbi:MAG: DUF4270 family protein, partial [Bacteroidetes bacterium]|nr:DUF4270 family protein [Bacteroidota bacterium]